MTEELLTRFDDIHAGCPWHSKQVTYYSDRQLFCNLCPYPDTNTTRIYWYSHQPTILYDSAEHKGVQQFIQNSKKVVRLFPLQHSHIETLKLYRKRCANCYGTVWDTNEIRFCSISCQRNMVWQDKKRKRKGAKPIKSPCV